MCAIRNSLAFFAVAILVGCTNGGPTRMPTQAEVAGVYVLSEKSSDFLVHEKHYTAVPHSSIVLRVTGEAIVDGMPDCYLVDHGAVRHAFLAGQGKWKTDA